MLQNTAPSSPAPASAPQGRLTLTTGVPVLTADVINAGTIYFTPFGGNKVPLWNGVRFLMTTFTELSQTVADATKSPAAGAADKNYDMFVWNDAGTLRCTRGPAWSSATARGTGAGTTELDFVQGLYVNKITITNGPAAGYGTYVGTVRTAGDSLVDFMLAPAAAAGGGANCLHVWNAFNRRVVAARNIDSTDTWAYKTETWRAKNNSAANGISFVVGLAEDAFTAINSVNGNSDNGAGAAAGIGYDVTDANHANTHFEWFLTGSNKDEGSTALLRLTPAVGQHAITPLEIGINSGTTTWFGDSELAAHVWGNSVFSLSLPM